MSWILVDFSKLNREFYYKCSVKADKDTCYAVKNYSRTEGISEELHHVHIERQAIDMTENVKLFSWHIKTDWRGMIPRAIQPYTNCESYESKNFMLTAPWLYNRRSKYRTLGNIGINYMKIIIEAINSDKYASVSGGPWKGS